MTSAFGKDISRSIKASLGRFIAIAAIVALGCGFYAGLRMTSPDMYISADEYYDSSCLYDIRVVSTLGLTEDDLGEIERVEGVGFAEGAFQTDIMGELNSEQYAMRVHSLPYDVDEGMDGLSEDALLKGFPVVADEEEAGEAIASDGCINKLVLQEGRWPLALDECVISADNVMNSPVNLGDEITIQDSGSSTGDNLAVHSFKVVGFAHSPMYVSTTAMGSTSLGSGTLDQFVYVPANDFSADLPFSEIFVHVEGSDGLEFGTDGYDEYVDEVAARINAIADSCMARRYDEVKDEAQAELDSARKDFEDEKADAQSELDEARARLDDAKATIDKSALELESGKDEYRSGIVRYEREKQDAVQRLNDAEDEIAANEQTLNESKEGLDAAKEALDAGWAATPGLTPETAPAALEQMRNALALLDPASPQYGQLAAQIASLERLLAANAQYESGLAAYDSGVQQLALAKAQLDEQSKKAMSQLQSAKAQLDMAFSQIQAGERELAEGRRQYDEGLQEYESEAARAQQEFDDAQAKIDEAQEQIDGLEHPEWLVMDRMKNPGVVSFQSDADRIDSIASFFPLIFFLVAALVALTTMTRMVEEERMIIGTYKALGYSRAKITSKYLIYAALASVSGSVIGIVALSFILPPVIMEAYSIIYSVPYRLFMPINLPIALSACLLGVAITLLATWAAVASTLRETPANLMLPRAPKEGKRILLERIAFVWRRMSFSWKVTFRNIFRYKKRLVMTIIGIAGCTALLLTGLGLENSINDIIDKQFGKTVLYNVIVTGDDGFDDGFKQQLIDEVDAGSFADVESMMASGPQKEDVAVNMVIPQNPSEFEGLWVLRDRTTQEEYALSDNVVIVTEKLANILGLGIGDDIVLSVQDTMGNATDESYRFPISAIAENYIANYVFLGNGIYEDRFGKAPEYNSLFAKVPDGESAHDSFRDFAKDIAGVKTVAFNNETIDAYRTMLKSVNMIVVVLVVAAAALAFIVLYNLTNINICERRREIATLKVLGFTSHEVDMYIYRETLILTILGALIGLVLGIYLEGLVIVTAEVDYVMFGRDIHALSFVVAFVVTVVFAVIVMFAMRRKLANIDMVDSLKSIE